MDRNNQHRKKILHFIYTEGISGAEKHIAHLLPALKEHGIDCELMVVCPPASEKLLREFYAPLEKSNVRVILFTCPHSLQFSMLRQVGKYLRENKVSCVHSHLLRSDLILALVKTFFRRDLFIISTKHGYREQVMCDYLYPNFRIKKDAVYHATAFSLKKINRNIAVSIYIAELFNALKLVKENMPVIPHGVDIPALSPERSSAGSEPLLVIVGRLEPLKGHRYVLEAMPAVLKKYPSCRLLLIGDGSAKQELIEHASHLGISYSVIFKGFDKNPYPAIATADLIIIPSQAEAFGLVFIEAMALKTPVIAFDVPAGNEIIRNEETGYLVPVFDVQKLAEKIVFLLNDPSVRERISSRAYEDYLKNYTVEAMASKTAKFYFSVLTPGL